ncbi:competence protein CoiA family protein [Shewanella sp. 10N.286.51.B2]|uniref:competence protein CoiA family protein n=1 Tax=Shewanella sp. 10N.286.51.B2 TaxID=3229707 RepID=UPI00354EF104
MYSEGAFVEKRRTMVWARHSSGRMKHIGDVPNGLSCECYCVDCNETLVAKNGGRKDRLKHFAHRANSACEGESALHFAAKQMIVEFREEGLFLPKIQHLVSYVDPLGCTYEYLIDRQLNKLSAYSAKLEQRIGNIVTDALIEHGGERLAVEIFYRHQKSEQDKTKFKISQLSGIEIDISMLEPNTAPSELKNFVLKEAPRSWMFNRKEELLVQNANQKLHKKSRSTFRKRLTLVGNKASNWLQQAVGNQSLPNLAVAMIGLYKEELPTPKLVLTSITTNLTRIENKPILKAIVQLNDKTNIPIFFVPIGSYTNCLDQGVHLNYWYSSSHDNIKLENLCWINLEIWESRYKQYVSKVELLKSESIQTFASDFQGLSNDMKFLDMAKRLRMPPGKISEEQKRFNFHWNAPNYIWQSIALNYFLKNYESIDCGLLAENDWLRKLLGFKMTEKAIEGRSKSIYFWMKKHLEPMGFAIHSYGLQWIVRNEDFAEKEGDLKLSKLISN